MTDSSGPSDRRATTRGRDRRREQWHAFREAYPVFLRITGFLFLLLVAGDMWLAYRRHVYGEEISRLRANMTTAERRKTDIIVQSEQDKLRLAIELAKRQAHVDTHLHLSIAVDSGLMYLERDGALLRVMHVAIAPAAVPGVPAPAPGDTSRSALPRGERTVQQVISDSAAPTLVLNGDTRIYSGSDTDAVHAGSVRASAADLRAILPNVSAGMPVYFY
jgi:hypothetical protein